MGVACGQPPIEEAVVAVVVEAERVPEAPKAPLRTRSVRLDAAWGAGSPACEPPCSSAVIHRLEASSARAGHPAEHAVDDDPNTSWCGVRGRRDQLLVHFEPPISIDGLVVRAPGVARLVITSDRWDEAVVQLGPPTEGASAPHAVLDFDEVGFLNVEITSLHEGGSGCIDELAFTTGG